MIEPTEHSYEWFLSQIEEVRRHVDSWPDWLRRQADWSAAVWPTRARQGEEG